MENTYPIPILLNGWSEFKSTDFSGFDFRSENVWFLYRIICRLNILRRNSPIQNRFHPLIPLFYLKKQNSQFPISMPMKKFVWGECRWNLCDWQINWMKSNIYSGCSNGKIIRRIIGRSRVRFSRIDVPRETWDDNGNNLEWLCTIREITPLKYFWNILLWKRHSQIVTFWYIDVIMYF